jgi:hypothetical protein
MTCDDRERFLSTHDDDPDGPLDAGEDESTQCVGVTVEDPGSGAWESVWGIGIPDHWSGMDCREHLWESVVGGYHDLLRAVRAQRDAELRERAEWEARDVMTA